MALMLIHKPKSQTALHVPNQNKLLNHSVNQLKRKLNLENLLISIYGENTVSDLSTETITTFYSLMTLRNSVPRNF